MADLEQNKYVETIRKLQILRLVLVVAAVVLAAALVVVRVYCFPKEPADGVDPGRNGETGDNQEEQWPELSSDPQMPYDHKPSDGPGEGGTASPELGQTDDPGEGETASPEPGQTDDPGEGETASLEPGQTDDPGEGETASPEPGQTDDPGEGETASLESGQTDDPGEGETASPEPDQTDGPGEGGTTSSEPDQTDSPEEEGAGIFGQDPPDGLEEGGAGILEGDQSGIPKTDKEDPKDTMPETVSQGDLNGDYTGVLPNGGFVFPEITPDGEGLQSGETGENQEELTDNPDVEKESIAMTAFIVLSVLFGVDAVAVIILSIVIYKKKSMNSELHIRTERIVSGVSGSTPMKAVPSQSSQRQFPTNKVAVGKLHNIGARPYQEDSSGLVELDDGVLAIVADGMGGLSGGDKVSQKIVFTMLSYGERLKSGQMDGMLTQMVNGVNEEVNKMLGPNGLYKSGSTLLAVLVRRHRFHWVAVGDSHIYLYHRGCLTQLNQEHNREQELLKKAVQGEISFEQAKNDPKKSGLTSFIGMGKLKYIDKSLVSIPVEQGDRIILMTDGVFNAVPDQEIASVLKRCSDVSEAAAELERMVIRRANPKQDNFTAVILGI